MHLGILYLHLLTLATLCHHQKLGVVFLNPSLTTGAPKNSSRGSYLKVIFGKIDDRKGIGNSFPVILVINRRLWHSDPVDTALGRFNSIFIYS